MSSTGTGGGISSSRPSRNLHISFYKVMPMDERSTTPARHSAPPPTTPAVPQEPSVVWEGPVTTHSAPKLFGQMSTAEKVSLIRTSTLGPSMLQHSSGRVVSQRHYSLARVTVFISIGRWTWRWTPIHGEDMRPGSLNFLITTGFTSTLLALRIYRRYSERLAPTTAKTD